MRVILLFAIVLGLLGVCSGQAVDYPATPEALMNAPLLRTDGSRFSLADLKGKVVLVNIWAIWCGPCRLDIPDLIQLQKDFGDKGLVIIGANIGSDDSGRPEWLWDIEKFSRQMGMNYEAVRVDEGFLKPFYALTHMSVVPQSVLIGRSGELRGLFMGFGHNITSSRRQTVEKVTAEKAGAVRVVSQVFLKGRVLSCIQDHSRVSHTSSGTPEVIDQGG